MSQKLRRQAAKQSSKRLAAANSSPFHTPVPSHPNTDDEDAWSDGSSSTVDSYTSIGSRDISDITLSNWEDDLKQCIDELSEKRASLREAALLKLVKLLSRRYTAEALENQHETLIDMLKRSIKKASSAKESTLAAKAITLTFITLGEDVAQTSDLYVDIVPLLKRTIINTAAVETKSACLESLAMSTLIAGNDTEIQDVVTYLADVLDSSGKNIGVPPSAGNEHSSLMTSALSAYGVLFAVGWGEGQGTAQSCWKEFKKIMPSHIRYLSAASTEIRVAAGENIALFFEARNHHNLQDEDGSDSLDGLDDDHHHNRFQIPEYDRLGELLDILSMLSTDSTRHRSKTSRATQKSAFRDILRTIESRDHPTEKLKFRRGNVTFHSWRKILILKAFRTALAEGLHIHFEENPLLHEIFHYFPSPVISHGLSGIGMSRTGSNLSNRSNRSGYSTPRERDDAYENGELPKIDQKYLNAEMAKMRTRDLKKARKGRSKSMKWED